MKFDVTATSVILGGKEVLEKYPTIKDNFKCEIVPLDSQLTKLYVEINTFKELDKFIDTVEHEIILGGDDYLEIRDEYY